LRAASGQLNRGSKADTTGGAGDQHALAGDAVPG